VDREVNQIMDTEPDRVWQPADLVAAGVRHPPYFAPGQEWHYSNTNTILLGTLIEHLTGQPLEAEVQRRIFDPLGMRNSLMPARTSAAVPSPHPRGLMSGHIF
jgi:D-alanyl-D-alanine carboxypeptidase